MPGYTPRPGCCWAGTASLPNPPPAVPAPPPVGRRQRASLHPKTDAIPPDRHRCPGSPLSAGACPHRRTRCQRRDGSPHRWTPKAPPPPGQSTPPRTPPTPWAAPAPGLRRPPAPDGPGSTYPARRSPPAGQNCRSSPRSPRNRPASAGSRRCGRRARRGRGCIRR